MSPDVEFYLKMLGTFMFSGLIFLVMMRMQKRKEEEADRKFHLTLKSRGMSSEIEKEKK